MTWQPGRDKVAELVEAAELERVAADRDMAERLLGDASGHLSGRLRAVSRGRRQWARAIS